MDEVDALSDRIAILDNGEIKCFGSAEFLKKIQNFNYILKLSVHATSFNQTNLVNFLSKNTKNFKIEYKSMGQVIVSAYIDDSASLNGFLEDLNDQTELMGVIDYTLDPTDIDDVFLRYF
jgi:ABC-type multidrug transport system ATPase subunit